MISSFTVTSHSFPGSTVSNSPPPISISLPTFTRIPEPSRANHVRLRTMMSPTTFTRHRIVPPSLHHSNLGSIRANDFIQHDTE